MTEEFLCFKRTRRFWGIKIMPCPDCDTVTPKMTQQDEVCRNCEKFTNL